ncbi:MAG: PIN domain-containing protein [Chloroflexota bacterium]|nr:PIN domain-containing protein [Chloroflexota bacterium]
MIRTLPILPRRIFLDTSAFFALASPRDEHSSVAHALLRRLVDERCELVTTNFVLAELHALLLKRVNRFVALQTLLAFDRSDTTTVTRVRAGDEHRAKDILTQYDDKNFSFADTTSFAVMERLGIAHVFSLDDDFRQYGWIVLRLDDIR